MVKAIVNRDNNLDFLLPISPSYFRRELRFGDGGQEIHWMAHHIYILYSSDNNSSIWYHKLGKKNYYLFVPKI